ncbi:MAG: anhydro-N-acetylmuramic acid kinase [Planctomycetota bacterium]
MHAAVKLTSGKRLRVAGLMSGTSADGVDVAVVDIRGAMLEVVAFGTRRYPPSVRTAVLELAHATRARVDDICRLNYVLGEVFAEALINLCRKQGVRLESIDLIGSHGQTVRHLPGKVRFLGRRVRATLQIGEPSVIAERTGIKTVADFRPRDIAAGGEGAPLVPYVDWLLFRHRRINRTVQNIGGIANVTWLAAGGGIEDVIAFDTGPGNMLIDAVVALTTRGRKAYDRNGAMAAGGRVQERLLSQLMRLPFLSKKPPKSTGREEFGAAFARRIFRRATKAGARPEDIVATVTAFTARSIADAYRRSLPSPPDEVILCGGGAKNSALTSMLAEELEGTALKTTADFGIDPDAKEAVSFAVLAAETLAGRPGNVPAATGAARRVVLGKVTPA